MTQFGSPLFTGDAYFAPAVLWNSNTGVQGIPTGTSPNDTQNRGAVITPIFCYEIGQASTALASGIFYSASGATGSTLTSTGALVSGGVATLDSPRCIRFTSSVDLSTVTITIRGTDGYNQSLTWSGVGPTGNTLGNAGSYVESASAFKTVTTASTNATLGTTAFLIGTGNTFGLPYRIDNAGKIVAARVNGATATTNADVIVTAGYTATGTPTATTADVRGLVAFATTLLPNGSRYFTVAMIIPPVGLNPGNDGKEQTYGATPFSN